MRLLPLIPLALAVLPAMALAEDAASDWTLDLRYRHEHVDDAGFARTADADTLRARLGWKHSFVHGLSAGLELEGVVELGDDFNSGANGVTDRPAVADARALEVNQAWLAWKGAHGGVTAGRQRLVFDNQRFIGDVGWRQNQQTFDAVLLQWVPRAGWSLQVAWLERVHRIAGDEARVRLARERRHDSHLLNIAWTGHLGTVAGYHYRLHDRDVATASSRTTGLRWTGQHALGALMAGWALEAAHQSPHAGNPLPGSNDYWLVEPALTAHGITYKAGWEHLGGDGTAAFQTPLATLHAFNGWADRFGVTPADGLEDRYVSVSGKTGTGALAGRLGWTVAWHDYTADRGGADYGREWNASLAFPLPHRLRGLVKFADYDSDGFGRDVRKWWLQVEWSL